MSEIWRSSLAEDSLINQALQGGNPIVCSFIYFYVFHFFLFFFLFMPGMYVWPVLKGYCFELESLVGCLWLVVRCSVEIACMVAGWLLDVVWRLRAWWPWSCCLFLVNACYISKGSFSFPILSLVV